MRMPYVACCHAQVARVLLSDVWMVCVGVYASLLYQVDNHFTHLPTYTWLEVSVCRATSMRLAMISLSHWPSLLPLTLLYPTQGYCPNWSLAYRTTHIINRL